MKTRLLPVLLLTATFPFAALAQSSNTTGTSAPSSTAQTTDMNSSVDGNGKAPMTTAASTSMGSSETFVTIPASGAWRVSDLKDKPVYSVDGSNIGDINDVLVSQNGSVNAVIISVGGFLGIGEKDVAVNMSALQMAPNDMTAATGTAGTGTPAMDNSNATAAQPGAADMAANGSGAVKDDGDNLPDRIVLNVTRDQLEKAPAFEGLKAQP